MSCLRNVMDTDSGARAVVVACVLLLGAGTVRAQDSWQARYNVRIENVTVAPRDARTATVSFDISWPESWRDQTNHDAAWVFFKVWAEGSADWQHVRLAARYRRPFPTAMWPSTA